MCCLGSFSGKFTLIRVFIHPLHKRDCRGQGEGKALAVGKVVVRIMALVLERFSPAGEDVCGAVKATYSDEQLPLGNVFKNAPSLSDSSLPDTLSI